eukprot:scaffold519138_cov33-Prasinocladus_malaysianus.AAC.1
MSRCVYVNELARLRVDHVLFVYKRPASARSFRSTLTQTQHYLHWSPLPGLALRAAYELPPRPVRVSRPTPVTAPTQSSSRSVNRIFIPQVYLRKPRRRRKC